MSKRNRDLDNDPEKNINIVKDQNTNKVILKKRKLKIDFLNLEVKTLDNLIELANKYNVNNPFTTTNY